MQLRACSILGTLLLALCVASPAFAAGKGKKKGDDSAESAAKEGDERAERSAKRSKKKKSKKDEEEQAEEEKKAEEGSEASSDSLGTTEGSSDSTAADQPDPNVWEKPPEEAEKPVAADTPPPVVEKGDNRPWSAGISAGWGFKTDRATEGFGADPYGLSAGVRGGYEFDFKLYVGVWFNWYLGNSNTGSSQRVNVGQKTTRANYYQFGLDVGYDWWVADIIIRPSIELGEAIAVHDATGKTTAVADFMFGPGITVIYPWDNLFLAGEFRGNVVTGDGVSALLIAAQFGMRFEG